jgi:CDP-diacylglycerol--glycerol-3-phosphate 3-phosphatidyltransferase
MSVAALLLFVTEIAWPFRIAALVQALEAMEEILITVVLPAPQGNVHSLWHARRIKKRP